MWPQHKSSDDLPLTLDEFNCLFLLTPPIISTLTPRIAVCLLAVKRAATGSWDWMRALSRLTGIIQPKIYRYVVYGRGSKLVESRIISVLNAATAFSQVQLDAVSVMDHPIFLSADQKWQRANTAIQKMLEVRTDELKQKVSEELISVRKSYAGQS